MAATASRVARWLLVEHRGAWGPQSVPSSRLPVEVARALAETARAAGARLVLVRRPAGVPCDDGRWVHWVDSRPGAESLRARHVATDDELLDLDPAGFAPVDGPLYLVCTHGRHDRCCAVRGRPVARALAARYPQQTWESSHIGGDRFAANVVVLPDGLYLGRVAPDQAVRVVEELAEGRLPAGLVRGRSSLPLPVQAAQAFAREALQEWRTTALSLVEQVGAGESAWRVRLADPDVEVVVRYDPAGVGAPQLLTCDADRAKPAPVFHLVGLAQR